MVFAIVTDALFREAIEKTLEGEGLFLEDEETLLAALSENTPSVLFLEIGNLPLDGAELIQKLKRNAATQKIPIVAFGNSLRADLLQDAREAGADKVFPKAAFREQLPGLIRNYTKSSPTTKDTKQTK